MVKIPFKQIGVTTTALTGINSEVKVIKGNLTQTFSRNSGEYEPDRSVYPLVLMPDVYVIDPDGVMANGSQVITVVEWFNGHPNNGGTLITNETPGFQISASGEPAYSLKITKNLSPDESIEIYARFAFLDKRVNQSVTMVRSVVARTNYFDSGNFSLKLHAGNIINVNPIYCEKNGSQWPVAINAQMYSGNNEVADENVVYLWYVKEGGYYRKMAVADQFIISGFGTKNLVIDAAKINTLDVVCRSAYYAAGDPVPTYPANDNLQAGTVVMVRLPKNIDLGRESLAGDYIKPGTSNKPANTTVRMKAVLTDSVGVIANPSNYYNITWYAKSNTAGSQEFIVGYGEILETTTDVLGVSNTVGVSISYNVEEKIGSTWNLEGSVYNGVVSTSPAYQFGTSQIADRLGAYLIKKEADESINIIGKLMKNNWTRFEDGSPAPTILENAVDDLGYDIVYGWNESIYTIEDATVGNEQYALFADAPFEYAGLSALEIKPTGITPSLPTLKDGKLRCLYFKFAAVAGNAGQSNLINISRADRSYPKTDLSQINTNTYAIAKNGTANTLPFAPLMDWNLLNITHALMNKFKTVNLHAVDKFGGGVSSNETVSEAAWGTITGIRYKVGSDITWTYAKLSDTPSSICYTAIGDKTNWSGLVSNEYPRMRTLEMQMALSYAAEHNVAAGVEFTFDGEAYTYQNVAGATPLLSGEMNARLYKKKAFTFNAFNTSGAAISVSAELVLQSSTVYGIDLVSADVFQYAGAGIERVANIVDAAQGNTQNICDVYLCTSQEYLDKTADTTKPAGQLFSFESNPSYIKVGTTKQVASYYTNPIRGTVFGTVQGGSLHSNAVFNDLGNYTGAATNIRVRMGHRRRGPGYWPLCSARSLSAYSAVSIASRSFAGGFQCRLTGSDY